LLASRVVRRLTAREWAVTTTAVLVVAASLAPWFRTRFASSDGWETNTASAWDASTWWSLAVVLSLLAAAASLGSRNRYLRLGCAAAGIVAFGLTLLQWWAIPPIDTTGGAFGWEAADPDTAIRVGDIVRDHLEIVHIDGLTQDVDWGLYAGLCAMAALSLAMYAMARLRPRPTSDPDLSRSGQLR
jgi:hypothetical protein